MKNKLVVVFDFDGTLADSAQATISIFDQLSKEFSLGKSGKDMFSVYGEKGARALAKDLRVPFRKIPTLLKRYREEAARIIKNLKPTRDMSSTLRNLKKDGFVLGILTSNSEENVKMFLEKNDLKLFNFIYSEGSLFGKDKVMKKMMKNQHLNAKQVVYVGDETRDVYAAKKAGIAVIAVSWGFNTTKVLEQSGPDFLARNSRELTEIVGRL